MHKKRRGGTLLFPAFLFATLPLLLVNSSQESVLGGRTGLSNLIAHGLDGLCVLLTGGHLLLKLLQLLGGLVQHLRHLREDLVGLNGLLRRIQGLHGLLQRLLNLLVGLPRLLLSLLFKLSKQLLELSACLRARGGNCLLSQLLQALCRLLLRLLLGLLASQLLRLLRGLKAT